MGHFLKEFAASTKLSGKLQVIRIQKITNIHFIKNENFSNPSVSVFTLSSEDKQEGERRGKQPLLSVWESSINFQQFLINCNVGISDKYAVYKLSVSKIHLIAVENGMVPIEVHWDPDEEVANGDLHCGIQGLYRIKNIQKNEYKNIKAQLAEIADLFKHNLKN